MKKCLLIITNLIFFACGDKDTGEKETKNSINPYADFNISIDTVIVDSGNEILMAATNSFKHAIREDLGKLYYWDSNSSKIEIVDLDNMVLEGKTAIEKEGPNGVGQNPYMVKFIGNDQMAFISWDRRIVVTDLEGEVSQRIKLDESWMTEGIEEKGSLSFMDFSHDGEKVYCGFINFKKLSSEILELDLKNEKRQILSLTEFATRDKYRISQQSDNGQSMSMTHPTLDMIKWNGKLLFWTDYKNSVYQFNPQQDTLMIHEYDQVFTANEKTGTYKNEVSTDEEMWEVSNQMHKEVNFTKLVWDDQNNVFYRFNSFIEGESNYKCYLSVLSQDFELIGEKDISDLKLSSNPHFVKDGKIHLFLNLDDELAFVRLSII